MVISPLNYRGTKRTSLRHLKFPPGLFVDVFGGSATVTLNRIGPRVYNDLSTALCKFFRAVRDDPRPVYDRVQLYLHSREEFERTLRLDDPASTWIRFNHSANSSGAHWGRVVTSEIKALEPLRILMAHTALQGVEISNCSWGTVFEKYDAADTVFYCDPPYHETKSDYGTIDHVRFLTEVFKLQGFVAVSHYRHQIYEKFDWSEIKSWKAPSSRANQREFLWVKSSQQVMS